MPSPASAAVRIGPSGIPERTLAYQQAEWAYDELRLPDGPNASDRWEFTNEQFRFLAWWYAYEVIDGRCRWVFRRGTLRRMKGWGKDPVGAVLCAIEAFGPSRPTPEGVGVRQTAAWVQVAAVSKDQTRTTFRLFPGLIPKPTRERYGIEVHKELVHIDGGRSVIEAITSSPLSAEGPRVTFVLRNEVQHWLSANQGHEMAEVIDGNLAKSRDGMARALSLCNAHVPGLDSIGEREWDAYQQIEQGRSKATGVLYDSLEAPPDTSLTDAASLYRGLDLTRGDATWLDIDRLVGEIWDPRTTPSEGRRKYLNQVNAAEDSWCVPQEFDRLGDPPAEPLHERELIALGFDGSKSDDHSALMAARISNGDLLTRDVWDPAMHGGEAPRDLIDAAVRYCFATYDVVAFFADLEGWESYIDRWAEELGADLCVKASPRHAIAWDMRGRQKEFTREGAERLADEITEAAFRHDGDKRVRQHFHNARRRPNAWGVSFGKEHRESKRKVDSVAASALARMARRAYLALPPSRQRRVRSGKAMFFG